MQYNAMHQRKDHKHGINVNIQNITTMNELMESDMFVVRVFANLLAPFLYPWFFLEAIFSCTDDELQERWGDIAYVMEDFLLMPLYLMVCSFFAFCTISILFIACFGMFDIHYITVIFYTPFMYISYKVFTMFFRER